MEQDEEAETREATDIPYVRAVGRRFSPTLTVERLQRASLSTATYNSPGFTFLHRTCICIPALSADSKPAD